MTTTLAGFPRRRDHAAPGSQTETFPVAAAEIGWPPRPSRSCADHGHQVAAAGLHDESARLARRAAVLERLARQKWREARRATGVRAHALATTAREMQAEALRLNAVALD